MKIGFDGSLIYINEQTYISKYCIATYIGGNKFQLISTINGIPLSPIFEKTKEIDEIFLQISGTNYKVTRTTDLNYQSIVSIINNLKDDVNYCYKWALYGNNASFQNSVTCANKYSTINSYTDYYFDYPQNNYITLLTFEQSGGLVIGNAGAINCLRRVPVINDIPQPTQYYALGNTNKKYIDIISINEGFITRRDKFSVGYINNAGTFSFTEITEMPLNVGITVYRS